MSRKLVLIDGHSILNRAFFGIPDLSNSEGLHTNAVYGFLNILFRILEEEQPDYLTVAFDVNAPTFRHQMQRSMDAVILRLSRVYGPTMLASDSKALAQFLKKGIAREDIVLKSLGGQYYSYTYVGDAVSAILHILLHGENGEAYNVADPASDITLKDLAGLIADCAGTKVVYELPDAVETAGYSKATRAVLDAAKLKKLGWIPRQTYRTP